MNAEMKEAINAIAADKGMKPDVLYAVLADALESAYKKMPGAYEYAWVTIDPETMEYRVIAQELDDEGEPYGDEFEVTPEQALADVTHFIEHLQALGAVQPRPVGPGKTSE